MKLDLQVSPEEIMSIGRWSWAAKVRLLSLRVVPQQQCTSRWAMARGHRLNTSIVLAAVHGLRSFSGGIRGRAFTLSSPSLPVPVPNKPSRFCGRKAKCTHSPRPLSPSVPAEAGRLLV